MAWIEVHQALPTHRKTLALADELNIEPVHAVGHLTCLWLWALDNAPDGSLADVSPRTLARAALWRKDPQIFADALLAAGLMDADQSIHDWSDYAGRLIERRKRDADRKRAERCTPPDDPPSSNGRPQDVPQMSDASRARVNRTQPNRTEPSTTAAARGAAESLVEEFYEAMGATSHSLTRSIEKRELVIAAQIVDAGAPPGEARRFVEWCRAGPYRPVPSDMRVYESKRAQFLADLKPIVALPGRNGHPEPVRHIRDNTGVRRS